MVYIYAKLIQAGRRTIEQVPESLRTQVEALLAQQEA